MKRIIGTYTGATKGPLLFCFGGTHGNETAGVKALDLVFKMLEVEPITNPDFVFSGQVIGILGNEQAYLRQQRYIAKDLNRLFTPAHVQHIQQLPPHLLASEDYELRELLSIINHAIATYQPERIGFLDLHTTSADGGIFSIVADDVPSLEIATALHAPVITGLLEGIHGTTLHYFTTERLGVPTVAVSFEAGQHQDPLSVNRSIAAVIHFLKAMGAVAAKDVAHRHDELLLEYAHDLPKIASLIMVHSIHEGDAFVMQPNYHNFQRVHKGEWLATDRRGKILCPEDGLLLMPLYQPKGTDGFFLVKEVA